MATEQSDEQERRESPCKVKERHTSHWDWDVLPRDELEAQMRIGRKRLWWRRVILGGSALIGVILLALGAAWLMGRLG